MIHSGQGKTLADVLSSYTTAKNMGSKKVADEIARLTQKTDIVHRNNIENWKSGKSTTVQNWEQLLLVAAALRLTKEETEELWGVAKLQPLKDLYKTANPTAQSYFALLAFDPEELLLPPPTPAPLNTPITPELLKDKPTLVPPKNSFLFSLKVIIPSLLLTLLGVFAVYWWWPRPLETCGELSLLPLTTEDRFLRHEGVSLFTTENTAGGVLYNRIRKVHINRNGLWLGYLVKDAQPTDTLFGVGHFNKENWANCGGPQENINDIETDLSGNVWVATEKNGVAVYDGQQWQTFTTADGLPSNETYDIIINHLDQVFVATWNGVARFDGTKWELLYQAVTKDTIHNDHVMTMLFDDNGDIWVGHVQHGISYKNNAQRRWYYFNEANELKGNDVRGIVLRPADKFMAKSIWIATADGGISVYINEKWEYYNTENGLPSNTVSAIAIDQFNRVWAGTDAGTVFWDGEKWQTYHHLPTLTIAFGLPNCPECVYNEDHVFTGTTIGLTHSRLPYKNNEQTVVVPKICFQVPEQERVCPEMDISPTNIIVTYPTPLAPGTQLYPEITLDPQQPYTLQRGRGDFLSFTEEEDTHLYGAFDMMAIHENFSEPMTTPYTFEFTDTPFIVPNPTNGSEEIFESQWRLWMHTRYTGPNIIIRFRGQEP